MAMDLLKKNLKVNSHFVKNSYIALGSNMANPLKQVCSAINEIALLQQSNLLACSKIYRSLPMETNDNIQQEDYINAVILVETQLSPSSLLSVLKEIDRKSTRLNSSHTDISRMPSSAWKKKKK